MVLNKLYNQITQKEFIKHYENSRIVLDMNQINDIIKRFTIVKNIKSSDKHISIKHKTKDMVILITKNNDEYFFIEVVHIIPHTQRRLSYYKCDEVTGLKQILNNL